MASEQNIEYLTIVQCTSKLVVTISLDTLKISQKLLEKNVISNAQVRKIMSEVQDDYWKASYLLDVVTREIEAFPTKFELFLGILSEFPWSQDVVKDVYKQYEQYRARAATLKHQHYDDDILIKITEENKKKLELEYSTLVTNVAERLEQIHADFHHMRLHFTTYFTEEKNALTRASNIIEIFELLSGLTKWECDSTSALEEICRKFGKHDRHLHMMIQDYKSKLAGFRATTKIVHFMRCMELDDIPPSSQQAMAMYTQKYCHNLKLKLKACVTEKCLDYIYQLWASLAEYLYLPSLPALLKSIQDGCIEVTWLIPKKTYQALQATKVQRSAKVAQLLGIIRLELNDMILYCEGEEELREVVHQHFHPGKKTKLVEHWPVTAHGLDDVLRAQQTKKTIPTLILNIPKFDDTKVQDDDIQSVDDSILGQSYPSAESPFGMSGVVGKSLKVPSSPTQEKLQQPIVVNDGKPHSQPPMAQPRGSTTNKPDGASSIHSTSSIPPNSLTPQLPHIGPAPTVMWPVVPRRQLLPKEKLGTYSPDPANCTSQVPFVYGIKVHECNEEGANFQVDNIEVTIPPGTIPQGITVHVEMGVALYGPFKFAENCTPVSPILWFCIQECTDVNPPVMFKLPHVVMDVEGSRLTFAKADHSVDRDLFTFKEVISTEYDIQSYHGILTTKHWCFLCLQEEANGMSLRELSLKKGYCLHILIKKEDLFTYKIILLCTYFLPTCIQALKLTYPEENHKYEKKQLFRFDDRHSKPHLKIIPSTEEHTLELIEEDNDSKILAQDVDFWTQDNDLKTMKAMHDLNMYPPHITIQAHCLENKRATVNLKIEGARDSYTFRISKQFGSLPTPEPEAPITDQPLQLDQHFNTVYTTICKSVAPQWEHFGSFLGIKPTTIDRIKTENKSDGVNACLRELVKEWLRHIDPPATKSSILRVLRELDFSEEANKLERNL